MTASEVQELTRIIELLQAAQVDIEAGSAQSAAPDIGAALRRLTALKRRITEPTDKPTR